MLDDIADVDYELGQRWQRGALQEVAKDLLEFGHNRNHQKCHD